MGHECNQGVGAAIRTGYRVALERHADVLTVMAGKPNESGWILQRLITPRDKGLRITQRAIASNTVRRGHGPGAQWEAVDYPQRLAWQAALPLMIRSAASAAASAGTGTFCRWSNSGTVWLPE